MTFSGKISFPSKVPEYLHVLFNLVEKHSPVTCCGLKCSCSALLRSLYTLAYFVFVFLRSKVQTSQKIQGECFTTSSKSTCKNSGTFEGKEILPEKVTYVPLALSHSIILIFFYLAFC